MRATLTACLLLFAIASCSMPETRIYSLYIPTEGGASTDGPPLVIRVSSPRHLSQPYIVYRSSPYRLELARYSRWQASPARMVEEAFREALLSAGPFNDAAEASPEPYTLRIELRRFEMLDSGGQALGRLVFDVGFDSPEGRRLYSGRVSREVRLKKRDFLSLAEGLSTALAGGIEEVKEAIAPLLQTRLPKATLPSRMNRTESPSITPTSR